MRNESFAQRLDRQAVQASDGCKRANEAPDARTGCTISPDCGSPECVSAQHRSCVAWRTGRLVVHELPLCCFDHTLALWSSPDFEHRLHGHIVGWPAQTAVALGLSSTLRTHRAGQFGSSCDKNKWAAAGLAVPDVWRLFKRERERERERLGRDKGADAANPLRWPVTAPPFASATRAPEPRSRKTEQRPHRINIRL